ncbi:MAG: hypothetical protein KJ709_08235 [Nanoarchaeota archaeon]|nr:hypothetical protein [Nanoarchaeota archaeon]
MIRDCLNRKYLSIYFLVAANLLPLLGVLFFNFSIASILILYWSESVIIGFFNVLKIILARIETHTSGHLVKLFLVPFFMIHYGAFMLVHLVFLVAIGLVSSKLQNLNLSRLLLDVAIGFVLLSASHAYSFYANYIKKKEYNQADIIKLMFQPYARIAVMHVTIILGAFVVMSLKKPSFFLLPFLLLKIFFDVIWHMKERKKFQASA